MAPTVGGCVCEATECATEVKEYIRYHIDGLPFTTARKITHKMCGYCKGFAFLDTNKELQVDIAKNRAFIAEQDRQYRINDDSPIIPINGYVHWLNEYAATQSAKQWQRGFIRYLRFVQTGEKINIVPATHEYLVYCNSEDKLSVAARQFVKPDDYFKLVSIQ
jgi:hypothetical protein